MQLVTLGEILIDFLQIENNEGLPTFVAQPGGAPANVACAASKYEVSTAFIGKVGKDQFGQQLIEMLKQHQVETKYMTTTNDFPTTLAFVHIGASGERSFSFYRQGCADIQLTKEDIDTEIIQQCRVFHFGSNSMTEKGSEEATIYAMQTAKRHGAIISFDPNIRKMLWRDEKRIKPTVEQVLQQVDILKVSQEELLLITNESNVELALQQLQQQYHIPLIVATLGAAGLYYHFQHETFQIVGHKVQTIDTTGAGDGFVGAMLARIIQEDIAVEAIRQETMHDILTFANAAAALSTTKNGAIPSYPTQTEIEQLLR